jgi:hypothetical protein
LLSAAAARDQRAARRARPDHQAWHAARREHRERGGAAAFGRRGREIAERDPGAGCSKKHGRTSFGKKASIGADEGSNLIRRAEGIEARILDKARRSKRLTTGPKYLDKTAAVVRAAMERPFALMKGPRGCP